MNFIFRFVLTLKNYSRRHETELINGKKTELTEKMARMVIIIELSCLNFASANKQIEGGQILHAPIYRIYRPSITIYIYSMWYRKTRRNQFYYVCASCVVVRHNINSKWQWGDPSQKYTGQSRHGLATQKHPSEASYVCTNERWRIVRNNINTRRNIAKILNRKKNITIIHNNHEEQENENWTIEQSK